LGFSIGSGKRLKSWIFRTLNLAYITHNQGDFKMAQNKKLNIEPIAIPNAIGNLINCAVTSLSGPVGFTMTQPYILLKWLRLLNTTGAAVTVSLYKGATGGSAANTQFGAGALSVPANSYVDIYPADARLDSGDFLTGIASATGVVLNGAAEIGVS
jgi:hypothetical protein